jgi:hypothetical protein
MPKTTLSILHRVKGDAWPVYHSNLSSNFHSSNNHNSLGSLGVLHIDGPVPSPSVPVPPANKRTRLPDT